MPRERVRVITEVGTRSRTKAANANETNINLMVARYKKTGQFASLNPRQPIWGDFSQAVTLEDAYNRVAQAQRDFMALPAAVRAAADHDPVTFLEMLADEGGTAELVKAGLPVLQTDTPSEGGNPAPQDTGAPSGGGVS